MNIYNIYREKIIKIITKANNDGLLILPEKLESINVDSPPQHFDSDISTNVAMSLSKINNLSPEELSKKIIKLLKSVSEIDKIDFVKPGFINIKFKSSFWCDFLKEVVGRVDWQRAVGR